MYEAMRDMPYLSNMGTSPEFLPCFFKYSNPEFEQVYKGQRYIYIHIYIRVQAESSLHNDHCNQLNC